jgi:hypothetical protein
MTDLRTQKAGAQRPQRQTLERIRPNGYASSAVAFVFALCMKYNRPSTGINSKWHRLAAAAKGARFALPTSSISPKAYAVSIGEKSIRLLHGDPARLLDGQPFE